jgi:hypothetical protein
MGTGIARHLHAQADAQAAWAAQPMAVPAPQPADAQPADAQPANAQPAPAPVPAPPPGFSPPDSLVKTAATFEQVARGVRRSIMLAQGQDAPKQQQPARTPGQHPAPAPDRTTARKRILRAVEDVIQRPPDNPECDDAEVLLADLRERMDTPDLDDDIKSRPAEDIIKDILRDLGLAALPGSRPWKRRTPADIAELNARAAAPSGTPHRPGAEPQEGHPDPTCPSPDPQPAQREPGHPAAPARAPVHPGHTLPEDPAEAVAFVLRQAAQARWRPPPED